MQSNNEQALHTYKEFFVSDEECLRYQLLEPQPMIIALSRTIN